MTVTALAVTALFLGYLVYNRGSRDHFQRRGLSAQMSTNVMTFDVNPAHLKSRIVSILVNNTMDLNILNNVMNHVLNRIEADMQNGGLLHGMIVERSIGSIDRQRFADKLAVYIRNLSNALHIPLMQRDHGTGSFIRRYMEGGGGSGGVQYGTLYGRAKQFYPPGGGGIARYGFPARVTHDKKIELLDETLRRL